MIAPLPLADSLMYLVDTAMIRRLDDVEAAYMIKHALVQDTAQATLLKNESKFLHLMVALALEQVNAERLDEYAAELAFHFELGEDQDKTLEYSMRAGDVAARVFANREALEHYARAIAIARRGTTTSEQIIQLYARRGRILEVTARYDEALASYLELHELAQQRDDRALELAYLMLRAPLHSAPVATFDGALAKQLLLDALGTARELCDETAEARVLWNLSLLSVQTMHPADGLMYGELALGLAEKLDLQEQQGYTLHELFIPYRATGQNARAREVQEQARAIFREVHNHAMLADNLGMAAQFTMYEGDLAHALEYATEGMETSRTIDNPFGLVFNSIFLSIIHFERGENERALEQIRARTELLKNSPPSLNPVWLASIQTFMLASLGAFDASAQMERVARDPRWLPTPPIFRSGRLGLLARARIMANDLERAARDLAEGIDGYDLGNALHPGAVQIPFAQAELGLVRGEYAQVLDDLAQQARWARANKYFLVLAENLLLQGRAYLGLGDLAQAVKSLREGLALAEPIGSRRLEYQILDALCAAERRSGNTVQAEQYRRRARAVLDVIIEQTPPPYRAGFMNLPLVLRMTGQSE